jgi:hypothetical protein
VEEGYPTAAAVQLLDGKALYRDVWFDKPPGSPYLYLLWGAHIGWPLRLAGALYVWCCCLMAWRVAHDMWSEREGIAAALLLGFFLTFGIPSAVMALAPDLLMVLPHLAAVYFAWRRQPLLSGLLAGAAVLINPKGVYVFAAGFLWLRLRDMAKYALAFLAPNIAAFAWFGRPYVQQVWEWGIMYAAHTFVDNPVREALLRTADWVGFQAALIVGAGWWVWRQRDSESLRVAGWALVMLLSVTSGWRFFPRYYFALLPPLVIMAAHGYVLMGRRRAILLVLLAIPLARFGPRYLELASDFAHHRPHRWRDLAMMQDSAAASGILQADAHGSGTLLVWGYRPDIFAYTRMEAGTRFLDSQPLTGVIADRHLVNSEPLAAEWAMQNRADLTHTRPTYIVDGLGPYNPDLAITNYPDLRSWLGAYREMARTEHCIIYKQRSEAPR